jgi:hypothetical protein
MTACPPSRQPIVYVLHLKPAQHCDDAIRSAEDTAPQVLVALHLDRRTTQSRNSRVIGNRAGTARHYEQPFQR